MVKVKFFAVLKGLVGKEEVSIEIKEGSTLQQLIDQLKGDLPPLVDIMQQGGILISVNQEVLGKEAIIKDGDEVAFLPPFAGG
ncbi:MAG: MoaD/ThiS family protein [Nitrospirota bacterium]|nr:MoaD/ThiS family protein [Nitrospirota bacterium]